VWFRARDPASISLWAIGDPLAWVLRSGGQKDKTATRREDQVRLRRSQCDGPGIRRRRRGKGFSYQWDNGAPVSDLEQLDRIRALVIPPAWKDVWICPWPHGHIQAIGTDDAGRRQYRYHDKWRQMRDAEKFDRVLAFGARLPDLRLQVAADLGLDGLPRERVVAAAVRLLDTASFRVGGEEYAEDHETYGVATLLKSHVRLAGDTMTFHFNAKSGQELSIELTDADVAAVVGPLKRRRGGGDDLLSWRSAHCWYDVRSDDVNQYVKAYLGRDFSAKDFRTWNANVRMVAALAAVQPAPTTDKARHRLVVATIKDVARHLGNTPAVCRGSYVDPRTIEYFNRGETMAVRATAKRAEIEAAVISFLTPGHELSSPETVLGNMPHRKVA
jgi:DNA topoisomerase IB